MEYSGNAPRKKLTDVSAMVSRILGTVSTTNLTEINDLVFAGVVVVAEKLGIKSLQSQHKDNKPWWKRRLEGQINELRKDLNRIEQMDLSAMKFGMSVVKEEIKQMVKAKAAKVKRYDDIGSGSFIKIAYSIQINVNYSKKWTGNATTHKLVQCQRRQGLSGVAFGISPVNITDKPND